MHLRCIVVDARTVVDAVQRRQERVSLRRVEVPARRIGTQRPCGFLKPFPCSQRECVAEKERNRVDRKRNRHRVVRDAELPVRKRSPRVGERKANQRRSVVTAERIRLLSPIHVAKRCCVAMVVVLRSLVVGSHDLLVKKVAVPVRLQREIRRSISLHVPRCLPVTCVQMPRIGEGRHRTPGRAVRRARRPRRFTVPAQTVRPKDPHNYQYRQLSGQRLP